MSFIRFDLTQNGKHLGSVAVMEQARNAAKAYAEKNGTPVSVIGYREDRRPREVIYHPDGRIEEWVDRHGEKAQLKKRIQELETENNVLRSLIKH